MKQLSLLLESVYGTERAKQLETSIFEESREYATVYSHFANRYWYKNMNMYVVYPDGVGGEAGDGKTPLQRITGHLDWIRDLGCNALHILPFLDSPLIDKGFDISDYYNVRSELGTVDDLRNLSAQAGEHGIRIFMDLVFNHISDQHEWFKKAESGDDTYRNYFTWQKERPTFIRRISTNDGVFGEYEVDGKLVQTYIMFPEMVGEIPHWRQGKDGYWYYHTFYPEQPDVNWLNPAVFLEFSKILMYWASMGFHFRLDAILFVGKGAYKDAMNDSEKTHSIIEALRYIARLVSPECALIVETYEKLPSVIRYFGRTNNVESQLSYNFHMCAYLWAAMIDHDAKNIWNILDKSIHIPKHGEWINFLRNHDELSINYMEPKLLKKMNEELKPRGGLFRDGHAISGRTFSLLGEDRKRFLMAYSLLASLPGAMGIIYGDEIGRSNRSLEDLPEEDRRDSRNINRGTIEKEAWLEKKGLKIYMEMAEIINKRKILKEYQNALPVRIPNVVKDVFAARYTLGTSHLYVFANLSETPKDIPLSLVDAVRVLGVNEGEYDGKTIGLKAYSCIWIQQ